MANLTASFLRSLIAETSPPCLSIYQPTHRHFPDNQTDLRLFKNLVKQAETSLGERFGTREIQSFTEPLRELFYDSEFWNHTLDGLAVFRDKSRWEVFRLPRRLGELAVVADSFHVKPLLRYLQSADRFHVLCLNRARAWLLEGNRYELSTLEGNGFPTTIEDILGEELTEPHLTVASYGSGAASTPMRHGHGSRKDERKVDAERFFRAIDRKVLRDYSKPAGIPLVLATLPEHFTLFRQVSRNPHLTPVHFAADPESFPVDQIRQEVWSLLKPLYRERMAHLRERFHTAHTQHVASADLADVAQAAIAGRVDTLLLDAGHAAPGRIDLESGAIQPGPLEHPEIGDMLDDLAEIVLRRGGQVITAPSDEMPSKTGLAALYRY